MVRVRFAPSPTGYLHIGAARTSLFNWLFARHHSGKFILRIEDTDFARSSDEMSKGILKGLKWLGLDWDEGPFSQSERIDVYKNKAEELVEKGYAYYCFCLPEEIQQRKQEASSKGKYWEYDRQCFQLTEEEKQRFEKEGRPHAIRFLVPEGEIKYTDLIHGDISVENQNIEDFVLLRGDGLPTYHLSVVVDDIEQGITHIIRGDDHITNTPKQILLYRAFDSLLPEFAHLALILGPDRKKLSKRHGVTSVLQFREEGYFPQAMMNFLAQMSWSPGKEERIYSAEEMIQGFSLEKLSKGSPIFDLAKLEWLNGQLISRMTAEELAPYVKEELKKENLWKGELAQERKKWFLKLIDLLKERSRIIKDFAVRARPFLSDDYEFDPAGVEKHLRDERLETLLPLLRDDFFIMDDFFADDIEQVLRQRAEKEDVKAALFIHAVRMLVVGTPVSPGIFDVLELIGKDKTIERIDRFKTQFGNSGIQ
jgi:glutamyl-tRNA synthetase